MKVLFCTNAFKNVTNGPAKFANLLLSINDGQSNNTIKVLTEDINSESRYVYKLDLKYPKIFKPLSHFFRMYQYHKKALEIKTEYDWDVIVYNNAFIGLWSSFKLGNSVGMINDDNNATVTFGLSYIKIRYTIFRALEKLSVKYHKLIIVNSNYTKRTLIEHYPLLKEKCEILYKGIKLNNVERTPKFDEPIQILFVKKDYRRGGLLYLLKSMDDVNTPIVLNIVGPFYEELDKNYLEEIKKSRHKINILGEKTQKETFDLMRKTDVFCVPSLKEALGVANIEAISHGCSVISTNVGGIPEVLDNGKNGWLVNPKDSNQISIAINQCIKNKELRIEKSKYAFEFINKFNIENTLHNFIQILSKNFNKE